MNKNGVIPQVDVKKAIVSGTHIFRVKQIFFYLPAFVNVSYNVKQFSTLFVNKTKLNNLQLCVNPQIT